jgi:hypothetical protein
MKRSLLPALIVIWITASPFYSDAKAADRLNVIYPSISGLVLGLWVTEEAGLFRKHGLNYKELTGQTKNFYDIK